MSPDQLTKIFQPFEQVGEAQRREAGTGLGLAIGRQLVRLMGGDIHVESQSGAGSMFWFEVSMPVAAEVAILPVEKTVIDYQGPRKRILIVDDVVANRAMLVDLLSKLGFDTDEAANGEQGLAQARAMAPDLIVMDMVMPVMDGLEATRRLRATPGLQAIPVIAVSASATHEDQAQSLAAGANAFLAKPIEQANLLRQIGALLSLAWKSEELEVQEAHKGALVAPPRAELEALHALALTGNMRDILLWVGHLESLGGDYRPFAGKLRRLAGGYQSKAILALVNDYLKRTQPP
jgi:CheY-like chemotaxis protein